MLLAVVGEEEEDGRFFNRGGLLANCKVTCVECVAGVRALFIVYSFRLKEINTNTHVILYLVRSFLPTTRTHDDNNAKKTIAPCLSLSLDNNILQ